MLLKKQKEVIALREQLAAREQLEKMQGSLLAFLVLALAGETEGVFAERKDGYPTVVLSKKCVREALERYYACTEDTGEGYRILVMAANS